MTTATTPNRFVTSGRSAPSPFWLELKLVGRCGSTHPMRCVLVALAAGYGWGAEYGAAQELGPRGKRLWQQFHHFKVQLTNEQAKFVEECAKAHPSLDARVTCGNTMRCFTQLFSTSHVDRTEPERVDVRAAMTRPVRALFDRRSYREFSVEKNVNWGELLGMPAGQQYVRDVAQSALTRLHTELNRTDDDGQLPRVFIPYLQRKTCAIPT